jgi:plasmid stabilization system protein ParE
MAYQIVWSQTAVEDLRQIVQFIALDDAAAAASLADRILNRIEQAAKFPFSNRAVPETVEESIRGHLTFNQWGSSDSRSIQ